MFSAIISALYAREKTGKGAYVDVAMFDVTLAFMQYGIMEYVATSKSLKRTGNRHPFLAPFDLFSSADEDFVICAGKDLLKTIEQRRGSLNFKRLPRSQHRCH